MSSGGETLSVGSASDDGTYLHRAPSSDVFGPIDWDLGDTFQVPAPAPGFATPSAIYVESPTYQHGPAGALEFALCGQYEQADHEIFQFTAN